VNTRFASLFVRCKCSGPVKVHVAIRMTRHPEATRHSGGENGGTATSGGSRFACSIEREKR